MASNSPNEDYRREEECLVLKASSPQGRKHLQAMGIEGAALVDALCRAAVEKAKKDEFDPPAAGGYDMYRYATRYMRIALSAEGWNLSDRNNVASAIHPETGISVTVCAGDAHTGSPVFQPTTKRPHGEEFCQQVFDQPTLFGDEGEVTGYRTTDSAQSWILLHHCTDGWGKVSVQGELSLPLAADKDGTITEWRTRIILQVDLVDVEGAFDGGDEDPNPDTDPSFEVAI